jgi:hypothetical protein
MLQTPQQKKRQQITIAAVILLGLMALHNQRLTVTDPENTYPKRIKRAIRVWLGSPENELEKHLIGKGIACAESERLYKLVAAATVVIKTDDSIGAGVFIEPNLIATAEHVVNGKVVRVNLADVREDALAQPGNPIAVESVHHVKGLDLAFVTTQTPSASWLNLETDFNGDPNLLIVGHPNGKYYSLQKARIKKKELLAKSEYVLFKDNEIFFGNSGGAIVGCDGNLVGVVSMMSNYQDNRLKRGIGINAQTIAHYAEKMGLRRLASPVPRRAASGADSVAAQKEL